MPPTIPINHYFGLQTNKIDPSPILLFHANVFKAKACFKHSNFFTVKDLDHTHDNLMPYALSERMDGTDSSADKSMPDRSLQPEIQLRAF